MSQPENSAEDFSKKEWEVRKPKKKVTSSEVIAYFVVEHGVELVMAVTLLAILRNNRKGLKFSKQVAETYNENQQMYQQAISALRAAGKDFTFYPGVGLYVNK